MFRRAVSSSLRSRTRSLTTSATRTRGGRASLAIGSAVVVGGTALYASSNTIWNDARTNVDFQGTPVDLDTAGPSKSIEDVPSPSKVTELNPDVLETFVWGSNKSKTLDPEQAESLKLPLLANWLNGVALRDLALHECYGACVDAKGNVYQWGEGYSGSDAQTDGKPTPTLRGKNIVQLQLTDSRVFALSSSGKVYVLPSTAAKQALPSPAPRPSWLGSQLWGDATTVDFEELAPRQALKRGEKFTSIAAGDDHLLALTSQGRTFAHPITKKANACGQLGFRRFDVADPANPSQSMQVELKARSPNATLLQGSGPAASENLATFDDADIRWCPYLFEVPALRGIEMAGIAAGKRSSFARTRDGRVLAWGANEAGQLGLGRTVNLDVVTVPTEVILWAATPQRTRTKCLDVAAGGNLTCFTVERENAQAPKTVEVLMCGDGQWGGLGANNYSNAQSTPLRARNISGLAEYDDATGALQPIGPRDVAVSPTGHVLLTLNTAASDESAGKDLVVWGRNHTYELGTGRLKSLPAPTTLFTPEGARVMLRRQQAKEVRALDGSVWKRKVEVVQHAAVGYNSSVVYWRIAP
ncbi:regulator of chromosome condensation 1/beta-lactamase-inhibitor protein II [Schizophyllum fasciatum]